MSDFLTRVSQRHAGRDGDGPEPIAVIELQGQLDGAATAAMNEAYDDAVRASPAALILDFSTVDYINSTGIALVVGLLAKARAAGMEVRACGLSDHYRHIFEITRLVDFMTFFPDEDAALTGGAIGPSAAR